MKRRVKTQPSNPFYSDEPAVAKGMIADKAPVQAPLGTKTPKMVPKHPAKMSGIAGFAEAKKPKQVGFKMPSVKAPAKPKTSVSPPKLRVSGHPGAHRIGAVKGIKKL